MKLSTVKRCHVPGIQLKRIKRGCPYLLYHSLSLMLVLLGAQSWKPFLFCCVSFLLCQDPLVAGRRQQKDTESCILHGYSEHSLGQEHFHGKECARALLVLPSWRQRIRGLHQHCTCHICEIVAEQVVMHGTPEGAIPDSRGSCRSKVLEQPMRAGQSQFGLPELRSQIQRYQRNN